MKGLTKRQQEMLSYIEEYITSKNFSPCYREIQHHFGFASIGSVAKHINTLKRKGVLVNEHYCGRSIAPIAKTGQNEKSLELELPYIGYISSNNSIETFPQSQTLAVPVFLVHNPEKTYVLRARGNSLHDEMIKDGDLLLVETRTDPADGETIVCNTKHHSTVIRQYHPEGNYVRLMSHSPQVPPLIIRHEDLFIQGVLISLLRLY